MATKLNRRAVRFGRELIQERRVVVDDRDAWSEHQPSAEQENEFIDRHGFDEYAKWHLGIDDEGSPEVKGTYKFPYGDFHDVHRCGLLAAEVRAGQYKYHGIKEAAIALLDSIGK